jgi:WD40 repeat protein
MNFDTIYTLTSHTDGILTMQAIGNILVTGGLDKSVRVWDIEKAKCVQILIGHTAPVLWLQLIGEYVSFIFILSFLFDLPIIRYTIISGSHDKSMIVWDVMTGVSKRTLKGRINMYGFFFFFLFYFYFYFIFLLFFDFVYTLAGLARSML